MTALVLATDVVNADEPAWSLKELNLPSPDSKGFRRYRIIIVWRPPGRFYEWRYDMGPAANFKWGVVNIIGGCWPEGARQPFIPETVGRVVEMAERLHVGYVEEPERPEASDLIGQYHDLPEIRKRRRKRQSTFGHGGAIQRSS